VDPRVRRRACGRTRARAPLTSVRLTPVRPNVPHRENGDIVTEARLEASGARPRVPRSVPVHSPARSRASASMSRPSRRTPRLDGARSRRPCRTRPRRFVRNSTVTSTWRTSAVIPSNVPKLADRRGRTVGVQLERQRMPSRRDREPALALDRSGAGDDGGAPGRVVRATAHHSTCPGCCAGLECSMAAARIV